MIELTVFAIAHDEVSLLDALDFDFDEVLAPGEEEDDLSYRQDHYGVMHTDLFIESRKHYARTVHMN